MAEHCLQLRSVLNWNKKVLARQREHCLDDDGDHLCEYPLDFQHNHNHLCEYPCEWSWWLPSPAHLIQVGKVQKQWRLSEIEKMIAQG